MKCYTHDINSVFINAWPVGLLDFLRSKMLPGFHKLLNYLLMLSSGVARVPCALEQRNFCAPTNNNELFEVKNWRKSAEKIIAKCLLFVCLFCYFLK